MLNTFAAPCGCPFATMVYNANLTGRWSNRLETHLPYVARAKGVVFPLVGKSIFVFDWDGTLFDSMAAKTSSFSTILGVWLCQHGIPDADSGVAELYRKHSGEPRKTIFNLIATAFGIPLEDTVAEQLSHQLYQRNKYSLRAACLFEDVEPVVTDLLDKGYRVFISSSVPQTELEYFVGAAVPDAIRHRLSAVLGSSPAFSKGQEHIDRICSWSGASHSDILVIGDDPVDYQLSLKAGVECVLVNREGRIFDSIPTVSSLRALHHFYES